MPQVKRSTAYHQLTGNFRASRHQQRPADVGGIGDAPQHLEAALRAVWNELAGALPFGVGSQHDRVGLELATRLVVKMRAGNLGSAETAQLIGLLAGFGLTPMGRQRLDTEPPPPDPDRPLTGLAKFRR